MRIPFRAPNGLFDLSKFIVFHKFHHDFSNQFLVAGKDIDNDELILARYETELEAIALINMIHDTIKRYGIYEDVIGGVDAAKQSCTGNLNCATMSEFWRTKDQKPEDDATILVKNSKIEDQTPIRAYYVEDYDEYFSLDSHIAMALSITHWMPMPK